MQKNLTRDELKEFISEVTVPIICETAGNAVAEVVRETVDRQLAEHRTREGEPPEYIKQMLARGVGDKPRVLEPGIKFARYVRALAAGRNDRERAAKIARGWGFDDVADGIQKSAEKAMAAGDPLAGGFLVPQEFSTDVIELLRATGVVRSLGPTMIPMPNGSIKVPRVTSGTSANYVGENTNITSSQVATGQLTLTYKKLAVLTPISNDLIRFSSPAADTVVRDDAVREMAKREDLAFITGDGTESSPKGLKNWIASANKFDANATVNLANVTSDLGQCLRKIMDQNITLVIQQGATGVGARAGWIFSPRTYQYLSTVLTSTGQYAFRDEMMRGTLWGFPFRITTQVGDDVNGDGTNYTDIYFGAFSHAIIGEAEGLMVDASSEAAYHDGNNVVAAYSQDQTVIRVMAMHDFALRHDGAFALAQQVTWGA